MRFPDASAVNRPVLVGHDEKRAGEAADRFGFARATDDWEAAIEAVDVLYNLAPTHIHAEPTIAALSEGVYVLCKKPLVPTLGDAEEMREAASESDSLAATGFNYRYVHAI